MKFKAATCRPALSRYYEIAAPEGYATDGSDIQTFAWDNSKDIELSFKDAPRPGIKIYKYDKETKMPLEGATFEIRRDGQVLATVKTDVNGNAGLYDLPKGFYQVVETEPPQGYLRDEQVHEVYIDPTADPTRSSAKSMLQIQKNYPSVL